MKSILVKFLVTITLVVTWSLGISQDSNTYSGNAQSSKSIEKNKEAIIKWWDNFSDCSAKKLIDSVQNINTYELAFAGQIAVKYHMYGGTSDGGIVKFKIRFIINESSVEYRFYDLLHYATPGVKHNDGGPILDEKSKKGSMIFPKTWKSYQEQTMSFIHSTENEIIRVVK